VQVSARLYLQHIPGVSFIADHIKPIDMLFVAYHELCCSVACSEWVGINRGLEDRGSTGDQQSMEFYTFTFCIVVYYITLLQSWPPAL